jgi:hypothetical protein
MGEERGVYRVLVGNEMGRHEARMGEERGVYKVLVGNEMGWACGTYG